MNEIKPKSWHCDCLKKDAEWLLRYSQWSAAEVGGPRVSAAFSMGTLVRDLMLF